MEIATKFRKKKINTPEYKHVYNTQKCAVVINNQYNLIKKNKPCSSKKNQVQFC